MPSVDEAFGVAYIEAMAGWVPAIGCRGEDGPEEIAGAGGGIELVPARDVRALADRIDALLSDRPALVALGARRARHGRARVHLGSLRGADRGGVRARARRRSDVPASEPYAEHNLLDRLSRRTTLEVHYRQMMRREQALLARRLPLPGGDVVSIGAGWHPGRHLFPSPQFRLLAVDADPEQGRRRDGDRPRR